MGRTRSYSDATAPRSRTFLRAHPLPEGARTNAHGADATPAAPAVERKKTARRDDRELVEDDLLVEDVSISTACAGY